MKYKGFINKSRTYDFAAFIAILTAVQQYVPQLELSKNVITLIGMGIAGMVAWLRKKSTGPVGEK